jgi:hypothetical protein
MNMTFDGQRAAIIADMNIYIFLLNPRELSPHDVLLFFLRDVHYSLTLLRRRPLGRRPIVRRLGVLDEAEEWVDVVEESARQRHNSVKSSVSKVGCALVEFAVETNSLPTVLFIPLHVAGNFAAMTPTLALFRYEFFIVYIITHDFRAVCGVGVNAGRF